MPAARLAHGFVFVVDLEPVARFYEAVFGMVRQPSADPGFLTLAPAPGSLPGAAGIALHAVPPDVAREIALTQPPAWRDDTAYKLVFATDDLDAHRALVLAHGGLALDPWTWDGRRFCECTDPEGNVIQLVEVHSAAEAP